MINNLSTYRILFIVKGILTLLMSLLFLAYAGLGGFFSGFSEFNDDPSMLFNPGWIFIIVGMTGFILTVIMGMLTLLAAKYINQKRRYDFVFVMAILNGLTGVLGILLAVFTCIELTKPDVKKLFEKT